MDKERLKEEYKLTQRLLGAFQKRLEELQREGLPAGKFQLDDAERQLLYQVNNLGLVEGTFGGIVALVGLRRVRASFLRRLVRERDRMSGAAQAQQTQSHHHAHNSPFSTGVNAIPPNIPSSNLDRYIQKRSNPFSLGNLFGWALDCTVAFSLAASISLLFTDRKKVINTLAQLPLVPGTSTVSRELCPSILKEIEALREESATVKDMLDRPQSVPLAAFMEFAKNCQLRQSFEKQYRQANGLSDDEPVRIPLPGLPGAFEEAGYSWSDVNSDRSDPSLSLQVASEDALQADAGEGTEFFDQQNWADDFTSDQDDQSDNSRRR
jgi:hypothetical protein